MNLTLQQIARALGGEVQGDQVAAPGPGHSPKDRSLSIKLCPTAPLGLLLYSHSGDPIPECLDYVREKLDLDPFKPTGKANGNGAGYRVEKVYDYVGKDGELLFQVERRIPKDFRQRRPNGRGGYDYKLGDVERVLYHLPDVLEAIASERPIFVAEGEKDVDALTELGVIATCNPGGSEKWRDEYSESLRGADVIVIPDKDEPGERHLKQVASSLDGVAARVRVIRLPVKDAADWIAAGGTAEKLWELVETAGDASADRADDGGSQSSRTLNPISAASFDGKPTPQRRWEVELYIPRHKPVMLYGDGGVGKSTIAMQLAAAKAVGSDWLGLEARPGPTLFLSAEDDEDELHIRLNCIRDHLGVRWSDLADVHLQSLVGKDAALGGFSKQQYKVIPTRLFAELEEMIRDLHAGLVILDTLSDVYDGDENDKQQARGFINLIAGLALRTQATMLPLAHPSLSGMASGTGTSGSVGWNNTARGRLYFFGDKDDDTARTLQVMKANYGPKNLRVKLRWQNGVYVPVSAATVEAEAKCSAEAADKCFLRMLDAYTAQGRHVSPNPSNSYAPAIFDNDQLSKGIGRSELAAAMNRLMHAGEIVVETFGPPSKQSRRIKRA